jgi:hypothetical protein
MTMRRQTPKQAAAFKAKATQALLSLGAQPDGQFYDFKIETRFGLLRLSPCEDAIRTRFDTVPKRDETLGERLNPHSGKWNFEFDLKPSQAELDHAISCIREILA